jgi:hypothetical protein
MFAIFLEANPDCGICVEQGTSLRIRYLLNCISDPSL